MQTIEVVHVDDSPFELEAVERLLSNTQLDVRFSVRSFSSAEELRANKKSLSPDVVILDINLGSDASSEGMLLADEVGQWWDKATILMRSSIDDVETIVTAFNKGASDFISKDSDGRELGLRVYNAHRIAAVKKGKTSGKAEENLESRFVGKTIQTIVARVSGIINSAITAVHVSGESGAGKEVVVDVFEEALQSGKPLKRINCGAIAPTLIESELFGHVKGAFTGAARDKVGFFEAASGGWAFLDEVATLSESAQIALLRVIENKEVLPVGATSPRKIDVRVISATNENLDEKVADGQFRQDLWQRLREVEIKLPPLRQRRSEIRELALHFCASMDGGPYRIASTVLDILQSADWKEGNVRELRNCLRAMTEFHIDKFLGPAAIPQRLWDSIDKSSPEALNDLSENLSESRGDGVFLPIEDFESVDFDYLSHRLLVELARELYRRQGKLSLRNFSKIIGVSRSTLSGRLKAAIKADIPGVSELSKYVGIKDT